MAPSQPDERPAPEEDARATCAVCGRELWGFGQPAQDGDAWICADCDAARNVDMMADW